MKRRSFLGTALSLMSWRSAWAQTSTATPRIGWLSAQQASSLTPYLEALRAGLADLGYAEGRNLLIDYRFGDDSIERVPELAAELLRVPVSMIVVQGAAVAAVRKLKLPVPVVYVTSGDPVLSGFAESFARPGGNMTGMTFMSAEMNEKRLEVLREIIPELRRVGIVANPDHPGEELERKNLEETAGRNGLTLSYFHTRNERELTGAFDAMAADPPRAICVLADGFAVQNRHRIIEFAKGQRVPVISGWMVFAQAGALCTYGPRLASSYQRLASYIDRVLKGAKPADLPIERPTTFELVINLKTAKDLGIAIPPTLLARTDEVIE
jgi:putative tryptophan/tyrosine transport system substrate-binding protein